MRPAGRLPRRIHNLAGKLSYERVIHECPRCRRQVALLDQELGVEPGEKMSRAVVRKVAYAAALDSFGRAAQSLAELAELKVSKAEVARVAEVEGRRLDEALRRREQEWSRPVSPEQPAVEAELRPERLVVEADGTCALTVAGQEHKNVWCAVAFGLEHRGRKEGSDRAFITEKRYTAGAVDMDDFGRRLKGLSHRMGVRTADQVAFIADGATCLWKWAEDQMPPGTVLIQDFWHVYEHLAQLALELWGASEATSRRIEGWKQALAESRLDTILSDLEAEHRRRRGARRKRLGQEIRYLENGRGRMDYARFKAQGWPIGSGAVEGCCKHLVKQRFCISGARWKRDRIAPVLALRLSIFNDQWDQDWSRN